MTSATYRLDVYDTAGALQASITDFLLLVYTRRVNHPGNLLFSLSGDHALLSLIEDKWEIEVWRKPNGGVWRRELTCIYRDERWLYGDNGSVFTAYCVGIVSKLSWRIVNWPAGTTNRTRFANTKAETIMKTLVNYNASSAATVANGRNRDGAISGITIETDGSNGNDLDWYCHGANLLETLQELSSIGGGDFDLVKTGVNTWQFRWYTGQLGDDLSATVAFSMPLGNMGRPVYQFTRSTEKTVAGVFGQGEASDRDYVTRTGDNYSSSNDIEMYVDARDVAKGDTDGLNARGDARLDREKAREEFEFHTLDTKSTRYGIHFDLGDLVTAINPFNDQAYITKVNAVTVALDESGDENIDVEMAIP
jgi:hypothetical protein